MKSIYQILTQFQTDLSSDIPALLTISGLPELDNYVIGNSRNPKEKALCIYKDSFREDETRRDISFIFQAQLAGIDFEDGAKYEDVLKDYFFKYNPTEIGMHILEGVETDTWPMDNNQGIIIFFTIQFSEMLDGCDNE